MFLLQFFTQPSSTQVVSGFGPDEAISLLFKVMLIILSLLYVVFAGLVIRQVSILRRTLETPFSPTLQILSYIHLVLAVLVFFIYLIIL